MSEETGLAAATGASVEVERIRDIIFGHQMREYDQQFQVVQRDLERLQQLIDSLSERLADQGGQQDVRLQQESARLTGLLAQQEEAQRSKLQTESEQLQDRLDRLGKQMNQQGESQSSKLQQEAGRLGQQLAEQDGALKKQLQDLRRDMRQADDDLRQELRAVVQKLSDDKTDRLSLGEMFLQVGNQLKQGDAAASLNDLVRALGDEAKQD